MVKELKNKLKEIEDNINDIEKAYAEECLALTKQKGFDMYKTKWKKKVNKIADKYAGELVDLQDKHSEIVKELDDKLEEQRKKKYKDY